MYAPSNLLSGHSPEVFFHRARRADFQVGGGGAGGLMRTCYTMGKCIFFKLWMDRGYLQIWHIQDEDHRPKDEPLRRDNKTSL